MLRLGFLVHPWVGHCSYTWAMHVVMPSYRYNPSVCCPRATGRLTSTLHLAQNRPQPVMPATCQSFVPSPTCTSHLSVPTRVGQPVPALFVVIFFLFTGTLPGGRWGSWARRAQFTGSEALPQMPMLTSVGPAPASDAHDAQW